MIEKYFIKGLRVKWEAPYTNPSPPKEPLGSIIVSDPKLPSDKNKIIYDGLDGELFSQPLPNVTMLGLKMGMEIPYKWLSYERWYTTQLVSVSQDVLTGPMMGCWIAMSKEKGSQYIHHIGTSERGAAYDKNNILVKTVFANKMNSFETVVGFNPFKAWANSDIELLYRKFKNPPEIKCFGLVTNKGEFYSILMFKLGIDQWCVGGGKKVMPVNRFMLYDTLTHP